MGKCNSQGECECRKGYETTDCSRSIYIYILKYLFIIIVKCPNDCNPNGNCISVHPNRDEKPLFSECVCNKGYGGYNCTEMTCPYGVDIYDCDIDNEEPPYLLIDCNSQVAKATITYNERTIDIKKGNKFSEVINDLNNELGLKEYLYYYYYYL